MSVPTTRGTSPCSVPWFHQQEQAGRIQRVGNHSIMGLLPSRELNECLVYKTTLQENYSRPSLGQRWVVDHWPEAWAFFNESEERLILLVFGWEGLDSVIPFLQKHLERYPGSRGNLEFLKYETIRIRRQESDLLRVIRTAFPAVSVAGSVIEVKQTLVPEKCLLKNGHLKTIPRKHQVPIHKLSIATDLEGLVISVVIDAKHPNADECGFFCLGFYRYRKLSVGLIEEIISSIRLYNLQNAFWTPSWLSSD